MTTLILLAGLLLAQDDYDARITDVKGEVTLYAAEQADGVPAEKDAPLQAGDRIVTGADSSAEVALDGEHVILVREASEFTLTSAARSGTELTLTLGSLLAKVQKLLGGQSFRVKTPTAVAAVRGTELAVEAAAGETHVAVYDEGKVDVTSGGATETLLANQETAVMNGRPPLPAYYLRRLERHRGLMRSRVRGRAAALRKTWRALPPGERQQLRRKALDRMVENRKKRAQKLIDKNKPNRGPNIDRRREQAEKDRLRREKLKERIRKGGRPQ